MARALAVAAAVAALALGACNPARPIVPHECVWTYCSPKTIAMSRCGALADPDTLAFDTCMRYEGYEMLKCPRDKPECWTGITPAR